MADGGDQTGIDIMIAGLACQVASLGVFIILCADYARCVKMESQGRITWSKETISRLGSSTRKIYLFIGCRCSVSTQSRTRSRRLTG